MTQTPLSYLQQLTVKSVLETKKTTTIACDIRDPLPEAMKVCLPTLSKLSILGKLSLSLSFSCI
jgi:hypothetical protein